MEMNWSTITSKVMVGPCPSDPEDFRYLQSRAVTAILSLLTHEDVQNLSLGWEENQADTAALVYCNVPVNDFDDLDLRQKLPACVEALDKLLEAGHKVYVHCTAGVTRSPTVVAAYLHWNLGWPLEQAVEHLMVLRRCYPREDLILMARRQP